MADTAIFLGAGASKAEGAPLQGDLFREYFSSPSFKNSHEEMDRELAKFFLKMFRIDVKHAEKIAFPTFEEVLGLTDLAITRKEAFKHFAIENQAALLALAAPQAPLVNRQGQQPNSGRLRLVAQYLVFLVAKVLDDKLRGSANFHHMLVKKLSDAGRLADIVFVSTNYDILIDIALMEAQSGPLLYLDYGVEFRNFAPGGWERPPLGSKVQLFKPHGSLNWLFCSTCSELEITPQEKGVATRLISNSPLATCSECKSVFSPLIVPPTFYKDLNNVYLSSIWNQTDVALRKVSQVIFCGYSFPDADMHIKYLLKRAQTNRTGELNVTVVNDCDEKKAAESREEERRYKRFLGSRVNYKKMSFQAFAANPVKVI
jgi:hypothetical protein